jgi:hypothetical protein
MDSLTKHEETKKIISQNDESRKKVNSIENCTHPISEAEALCQLDPETACAIIDSMPQLSGAFMLFCVWTFTHKRHERAMKIWQLSQQLRIPAYNLLRMSAGGIYQQTQFLIV